MRVAAVFAILAACAHDRPAEQAPPTANVAPAVAPAAVFFEVRGVVPDTRETRSLFQAIRTEPIAGIEAEVDAWRGPDGAHLVDYFLVGPSVEALSSAIAAVQRARPEAIPPRGRAIAFGPSASGELRSYVVDAAAFVDDRQVRGVEVERDGLVVNAPVVADAITGGATRARIGTALAATRFAARFTR